jgi:hypothetical protein
MTTFLLGLLCGSILAARLAWIACRDTCERQVDAALAYQIEAARLRSEAARLFREGRRDVEIAAEVRATARREAAVFARGLIYRGMFDVAADGPPIIKATGAGEG